MIKEFKEAIAKPSYPEITLRSLFTGYLVPIIAAPFVGIIVGLATSISRPSLILVTALTVFAVIISTNAGLLVGIRAGNEVKKSAEVARVAVAKAVVDIAADVASKSAFHRVRSIHMGSPPSAASNVSTVST